MRKIIRYVAVVIALIIFNRLAGRALADLLISLHISLGAFICVPLAILIPMFLIDFALHRKDKDVVE